MDAFMALFFETANLVFHIRMLSALSETLKRFSIIQFFFSALYRVYSGIQNIGVVSCYKLTIIEAISTS